MDKDVLEKLKNDSYEKAKEDLVNDVNNNIDEYLKNPNLFLDTVSYHFFCRGWEAYQEVTSKDGS